MITGEVGAGKTVAVRAALAGLDASRHTIIYLGNPAIGTRGIYAGIVTALGGVPRFHKAALIPQTVELLAAEANERGRDGRARPRRSPPARPDQLEELRLLTNADMDSHSPFTCLLVGQPTLRRRIKLGTFAALDQRIALRYAMTGMQAAETTTYLAHHLKLAGRTDTLFSDDADRPDPPSQPRTATSREQPRCATEAPRHIPSGAGRNSKGGSCGSNGSPGPGREREQSPARKAAIVLRRMRRGVAGSA